MWMLHFCYRARMTEVLISHGSHFWHCYTNAYQIARLRILINWKYTYLICVIQHGQFSTGSTYIFYGRSNKTSRSVDGQIISLVIYRDIELLFFVCARSLWFIYLVLIVLYAFSIYGFKEWLHNKIWKQSKYCLENVNFMLSCYSLTPSVIA